MSFTVDRFMSGNEGVRQYDTAKLRVQVYKDRILVNDKQAKVAESYRIALSPVELLDPRSEFELDLLLQAIGQRVTKMDETHVEAWNAYLLAARELGPEAGKRAYTNTRRMLDAS